MEVRGVFYGSGSLLTQQSFVPTKKNLTLHVKNHSKPLVLFLVKIEMDCEG